MEQEKILDMCVRYRRLYSAGVQWLITEFMALFERMIAQGDMHRPGQKGVLHRVATNTFILWTSWVNFLTTSKSDPDVHPRDMLDGALQSFLSFEPYLAPRFAAEVRVVFESHARK